MTKLNIKNRKAKNTSQRRKSGFLFLSFIFYFLFFISKFNCSNTALADTVFLKNGEQKKGIVVEEYIDRIKLSTIDGEIEILKSDIKDILYDLMVQNLIKLGDFHMQKGNLARAYAYYHKAYQSDPSFEPAASRYLETRSKLLQQPQQQLEERLEKKKVLLRISRGLPVVEEEFSVNFEEKLKKQIGLRLIPKNGRPFVGEVFPGSPAFDAGIKTGDCIIAVWNRLTGYMELEEVCDMILDTRTGEVKLTIEREAAFIKEEDAQYTKGGIGSTGLYLDITDKGLTITGILDNSISQRSGFLESDVITKISGKPTRYMPRGESINLIKSLGEDVTFTIHRDITVWKRSD